MSIESLLKKPFPTRSEMLQILKQNVNPITRTEHLSFNLICGRVMAETIYSLNTLPNAPSSRFDGIAVRYDDFKNGAPDTSKWSEGKEYVFSNTGIAVPLEYDTVIPIEEVRIFEEGIEINKIPENRGEFVNPTGSNMGAGERIISKNEVCTSAHIGLFASAGISEIEVFSKPKVGIIPTGDELINPTNNIPLGKNIDSNSYMIESYISEWASDAIRYPIIKDDPEEIKNAIIKALEENDAAIIIAGSSLGTKDFTISVLDEIGEVIVPQLAHGPGRKSSLSIVNGKPVLGIAGPPLGAQITCDLYLNTFISALRGIPHVEMQQLEVICDDAFKEHDVDFCERVHVYKSADGYHMRALFIHKLTRAQMQAMANGNYYREAGTSCNINDTTTIELLCPLEYIPTSDLTTEILEL